MILTKTKEIILNYIKSQYDLFLLQKNTKAFKIFLALAIFTNTTGLIASHFSKNIFLYSSYYYIFKNGRQFSINEITFEIPEKCYLYDKESDDTNKKNFSILCLKSNTIITKVSLYKDKIKDDQLIKKNLSYLHTFYETADYFSLRFDGYYIFLIKNENISIIGKDKDSTKKVARKFLLEFKNQKPIEKQE